MHRSVASRFPKILALLAVVALFAAFLSPAVFAAGPSLAASPSSVVPGGTVTVSWSGIPSPSKYDWIGLYKVGASNYSRVKWVYTSGSNYATVAKASGSVSFTMPTTPGDYEFRLFSRGGWTRLAVSNPVAVASTSPTSTPSTVSPTATPVPTRTPTSVPATSTPVATATATPVPTNADMAAEDAALGMINQSRQQYGLPPLTMYEPLRQVARNHAKDMATRNYFSHTTPEGLKPWDRITAAGITWRYVAENIGWGQGYRTPTDSVRANHTSMMAETPPNDGHRKNILSSQARRVGIGVFTTSSGKTYYVTDFID